MISKIFKLNNWQDIIIPINHSIYYDVLAAIITNQNINPIVTDTLIKLGYYIHPGVGFEYWYDRYDEFYNVISIVNHFD